MAILGHLIFWLFFVFFCFHKKISFPIRVLIGLVIGIFFGYYFKGQFAYIEPLGNIFISLLKMVVIPLIFASIFLGVSQLSDLKKFGELGLSTILFYVFTTAVAITIGVFYTNLMKPGIGLSIQAEMTNQVSEFVSTAEKLSIAQTLLKLIPSNPFKALVEGNLLSVIFLAVFSGISSIKISEKHRNLLIDFFQSVNDVTIRMIFTIMKITPLAVFALAVPIGNQAGLDTILSLGKYMGCVIGGLLTHVIIVNLIFLKLFTKHKIGTFAKTIFPVQLTAFSTSSSSATLPLTHQTAVNKLGVQEGIAGFILPLGATINMDGTALYQGVATVFIAQMYGVDLSIIQQLTVIIMAVIASIGTPAIPAAGIITLTMILQSVNVPVEGIAIILSVDRLLDMFRTSVNVTGDLVCATVLDKKFKL